jgi:diguanylate cyclase (GGDEF)-like protein
MSLVHPPDGSSVSPYVSGGESHLDALTHRAWNLRERDRPQARGFIQEVLCSTNSPILQAQAKIVLAYIAWREGHLAEALEAIQGAMSTVREQNALFWLARALNARVCISSEMGEFAECVTMLEEQLSVSRETDNKEMEACAIHDMGAIHLEREPSKAEPFFLRSLELFQQQGLEEGCGYSLLNLAFVHETQGQLAKAHQCLDEVLKITNQQQFEHLKSYAIAQQGRLAFNEGKLEEAKQLFLVALERTERFGDRPLAELIPAIVRCYRQLGNLGEARELLERHLAILLREGLLPFAAQTHELLTDILEEQGDFQGALKHSREHMRLYRKVYAKEHENKVRALEVLHRTHLAEHKAANEQQRNNELQRALDELERLNQQTIAASLTDELTGLHNRRYLINHVMTMLRDTPFSLAVVDLDHFKRINDTYGHEGGDKVLREFAQLLKTQVREHDIVIRFGGEEFIVIFPNTEIARAKTVLTRVLAEMQRHAWSSLKTGEHPTFTAGLAECLDSNLNRALQIADGLLYVGKANGRNGIWVEFTEPK